MSVTVPPLPTLLIVIILYPVGLPRRVQPLPQRLRHPIPIIEGFQRRPVSSHLPSRTAVNLLAPLKNARVSYVGYDGDVTSHLCIWTFLLLKTWFFIWYRIIRIFSFDCTFVFNLSLSNWTFFLPSFVSPFACQNLFHRS